MEFEPIGFFKSGAAHKYALPRQGVMHKEHPGVIELAQGRGFEQALRDLEGFERIWVVFVFHLNTSWRPIVKPPVPPRDHERVGVFASRSPYRPNPIGLSCVRLTRVDGLALHIDEADLIDGTPVLDIKPYIPKADAFPDAAAGWTATQNAMRHTVTASELFAKQNQFIVDQGGPDLHSIADVQLRENPFDASRKRVKRLDESRGVLSIRMFRVSFRTTADGTIVLESIASGYTENELRQPDDPHGDKALHIAFSGT